MLASAPMALNLMDIRRDIRRTAALLNTRVPDGLDVLHCVSNHLLFPIVTQAKIFCYIVLMKISLRGAFTE